MEKKNDNYILGSHNSWSYLKPKKWWMRIFSFTAKCQEVDIKTQYEMGVRCFDLRLNFFNGEPEIVHNAIRYAVAWKDVEANLEWLEEKGDVFVRVLLDVRTESSFTERRREEFIEMCAILENRHPGLKFWCGKVIFGWKTLYEFGNSPSCEENYSSVRSPKWLDDWWPWLYARKNNAKIVAEGTDKDILLIDFVNIK